MSTGLSPVPPVDGQVIPISGLKQLAGIVVLSLLLVFGIVSIWAWWTGTDLPLPLFGERNRFNGAISGAFMVVIAALFLPILILWAFAREKLIIAADRLQKIQNGQVVAQIPFRNIAGVSLAVDDKVPFIGIDLKDPDDADTFTEVDWPLRKTKEESGWHYRLDEGYQRSLLDIEQILQAHLADKSSVKTDGSNK